MSRREQCSHGSGQQPSPEHELIGRQAFTHVGQEQRAKGGSGTMAAKEYPEVARSGGKLGPVGP